MPTVTFTGSGKKYQVDGPGELPAIIRMELGSQNYPQAAGMTVSGRGAQDILEPHDSGFPCQISTYYFDSGYEGSSVNPSPDHVLVKLSRIRPEKDPQPFNPVYAAFC